MMIYLLKAGVNMKKRSVLWLTQTAIGIALVLIAQLISKVIPALAVIAGPFNVSQLITGTLVNTILIIFTVIVGVRSGVTIGMLSSVLATLLGIGPIFPIITPFIAIGNALLVITYYLFHKKQHRPYFYIAIVVAAAIKCAFLWCTVPFALNYVPDIQPIQRTMLSLMFSWPQGITALCGGLISAVIYPLLSHALNKHSAQN